MYDHQHTYRLKTDGVGHELQYFTMYEHHAQDMRVQGPIFAAPTFGASNANSPGISGNNPLIVFRSRNRDR